MVKPSFLFDNFLTHLAVYLTLIVGMINIFIQFHRLKTENITQNRMKWINDVRDISAEILSFDVCDFMRNNRNEIEFIIDKDIKTLT
ncbi:MAG: hypothetical protein LBU83_11695, partial [Bacteroidales bacterium]|nr:hypothetical protein [Bacteroidales bacterium]